MPSATTNDPVKDTTIIMEREQKSESDSISDDEGHKQARVSFRNIEVYEHSYILGDNPSVSGGAPLSLSWKNQGIAEFDLDQYESERSRRKDKSNLRMSNSDRATL
jgi:hypothetical protein